MKPGTPRDPVTVEVVVGGATLTTSPLPAERAEALWNEQHALGRRVRLLPWDWGERPPWMRDGKLRLVSPPGRLEYRRSDGRRYVLDEEGREVEVGV